MKKAILVLIVVFAVATVFAQVNSSTVINDKVTSQGTVTADDCASCTDTHHGKRMGRGHGRGRGHGHGLRNGKGQGRGRNRTGRGINKGNGVKSKITAALANNSISVEQKAKLNSLLAEFNAEKSKKKCACGTDSNCGAFKNIYIKRIETIISK
ncbi:hypothetical protein KAJ27_09465 [bacterium]|nr:hypothetical protein [bacterium]